MKFQTGVSKEQFLNDIAIELTGHRFNDLDPQAKAEIIADAEMNTTEWERILYFD